MICLVSIKIAIFIQNDIGITVRAFFFGHERQHFEKLISYYENMYMVEVFVFILLKLHPHFLIVELFLLTTDLVFEFIIIADTSATDPNTLNRSLNNVN